MSIIKKKVTKDIIAIMKLLVTEANITARVTSVAERGAYNKSTIFP